MKAWIGTGRTIEAKQIFKEGLNRPSEGHWRKAKTASHGPSGRYVTMNEVPIGSNMH